MARKNRLLLARYPHHLVRKSQRQEIVFLKDADYIHCLVQIRKLSEELNIGVHAYCILPDRVHIVATPRDRPTDLSVFMKALSSRISLRRKNVHSVGSIWEATYRSSPVEPGHWLLACICYVERLPVIQDLASYAYQYRHSSYRMRLGKTDQYWLSDTREYKELGDTLRERVEAYQLYMKEGLDGNEQRTINTAVLRGELTGTIRFVSEVDQQYGVLVPRHRPRRKRKPDKE